MLTDNRRVSSKEVVLSGITTEFKVGLFTILGLMATGSLFVVLNPNLLKSKKVNTYYTILQDASGVVANSHVKTNGVSVGKVSSVKLQSDSTKIEFQIDADVQVPLGSTIEIRTVGLLGDPFLEIMRKSDQGQGYLSTGEFIPKSDKASGLDGLVDLAIKMLDENRKNARELIANLRESSDSLKGMLNENRDDVRNLIANIKDVSASLKDMLNPENVAKVNRILASFEESMIEVKGATRNINLISQKVESGQGTLGKLINDDETLTQLQAAIEDVRTVLAPATRLRINVDVRGEGRSDKTAQNYFDLQFRTRPDRFYLLGVTDVQQTTIDTTTESLTPNKEDLDPGGTGATRSREIVRQKDRLRFNLQLAKRWKFAQVRMGMFESTGGFATDLFMFRNRLRLSLEAFDWDSYKNPYRRTAHFKAWGRFMFYEHIYLLAGVDDITRLKPGLDELEDDPNYFFGAGLYFNDEDLKALFGTAALAF